MPRTASQQIKSQKAMMIHPDFLIELPPDEQPDQPADHHADPKSEKRKTDRRPYLDEQLVVKEIRAIAPEAG